jgi:hypothetical protein
MKDEKKTVKNILLFGECGSGKTFFLKYLCSEFSRFCLESETETYIPIYIPLVEMSEKGFATIQDFIEEDTGFTKFKEVLKTLFEKKIKIIFLLDGLDEVLINRKEIFDNLTNFMENNTNWARFLISTRVNGISNEEIKYFESKIDFTLLKMQPLSIESILKYLGYLSEKGFYRDTEISVFQSLLEDNKTMSQLLSNPHLLHVFLTISKTDTMNKSEEKLFYDILHVSTQNLLFDYSFSKIKTMTYEKSEEHIGILEEVSKSKDYYKLLKEISLSVKAGGNKAVFDEKDIDEFYEVIEEANKPAQKVYQNFKLLLKANLVNVIQIYDVENDQFTFLRSCLCEFLTMDEVVDKSEEKKNDNGNDDKNSKNISNGTVQNGKKKKNCIIL